MRALVAIASVGGFVASAVSHGLAIFGWPLFESKLILFALHAGLLIVFVAAVAVFRRIAGGPRSFSDFALLPPWSLGVMLTLFLYALVNFVNSPVPNGTPERQGESFLLAKKGGAVSELSYAEYKAAQAGLIRAISGHWMFFYATAGLLMLARKDSAEA